MRSNSRFSLVGALLLTIALTFFFGVNEAKATGTRAGTTITSTANITYKAGTNNRSASAQVSVTVAYNIALNVTPSSQTTTTVDSTTIYQAFTFYNVGNYDDNFRLDTNSTPGGWQVHIYKDKGTIGTWDGSGIDSSITSGGHLSVLENDSVHIILAVTIPRGSQAQDNTTYSSLMKITSEYSGNGSIFLVDSGYTLSHTAHVTIQKPVISVTGVQTLTVNKIPGDDIKYDVTIQNSGHAAISGSGTFTFKLDTAFVYVSGGDSVHAPDGLGKGGTVYKTLSSLGAISSSVVTIHATIEKVTHNTTGAPYNTTITAMDSTATPSTKANFNYSDGVHAWDAGSSSAFSFTVGRAAGAYFRQITANTTGNPGDSVGYTFHLLNRGNSANTFSLSSASGGGNIDTTHWFDTTGTNSKGAASFTTASVSAGDSVTVIVTLYVNVTGANGDSIKQTLSVAPVTSGATPNESVLQSVTIKTTVTSPNLTVAYTTSHIGGVGTASSPAPSDTIEYTITITNNGSGSASNVTVTNAIPSNTTFLTNGYASGKGIQVDGTPNTNANDPPTDYASCDGTTLSAGPYTIAASGTKTIKFRVTIN
ncbi:MAG: DUF11 domain-containing protein [Bacteroidota bacterium]|nr:DUF11 domain-containing protein [Bacteroidota bacterium]